MEWTNDIFSCTPLCDTDSKDIELFSIMKEAGKGLEIYLKQYAYDDEANNLARTYIVRNINTKEIAGYFSLKASMMSVNNTLFHRDTLPGVELANFAVNDAYRSKHPQIRHIGKMIFRDFVIPISKEARKLIGIQNICIYALPERKLIRHYSDMGFQRLSKWNEFWVHKRMKPRYDQSCIFMYQPL